MSPREILNSNYEIVVTLDSIVEATGNSTQVNMCSQILVFLGSWVRRRITTMHQARSSYLPNEILWGFRFHNLVHYAHSQNVYAVDCSAINREPVPDNTPRVSAQRLEEARRKKASFLLGPGRKLSSNSSRQGGAARQRHSVVPVLREAGVMSLS